MLLGGSQAARCFASCISRVKCRGLVWVLTITERIAFATGSSWGTFAIMLAVAIPLSNALGQPPAPFVAAVLSGGIFGDHCSPISDTTIIASLASATDHIEHVRTQLPYALIAGGIAAVGFVFIGALLP